MYYPILYGGIGTLVISAKKGPVQVGSGQGVTRLRSGLERNKPYLT